MERLGGEHQGERTSITQVVLAGAARGLWLLGGDSVHNVYERRDPRGDFCRTETNQLDIAAEQAQERQLFEESPKPGVR